MSGGFVVSDSACRASLSTSKRVVGKTMVARFAARRSDGFEAGLP
jgi:hypothetical protein